MKLKSCTLVCIQILSIIAMASIIAPHVLPLIPTVPVVHAVGPNAAVSQLRCLLVLPGPAVPCPDKLPLFESLVYDADSSGNYTPAGGDTVIVGPIPTVGALLSSDPKILYRETGVAGDNVWNPGETIFYNTNNTVNGRVFLIGNPTGVTGASIGTDPKIKFVDTNANGVLDGVISVVTTLHNLGGILPDGSEQEVDAMQVVYTYDPAALKVMRSATGGGTLPGQYDRFCLIPVPPSNCTGPGKYSWLVDTYCADSGGSTLDSVSVDELTGKISSSSLCTQGPPRDSDVGIGCDPNYASPIRTGTCPGDILGNFPNIGVPNGPLTDLDVMTVQFMVQVSRSLSFTQVVDTTGTSGTKLLDIDGTTSTTICGAGALPCTLVNASNGPVACFTFSPSAPSSGGTVNFDAGCSTDPDSTLPKPGLTYAWDFGDMSPAGSGATTSHMYTCSVQPNCPFTVKLTITDTNTNTDSTSQTIIVAPPPPAFDFGLSVSPTSDSTTPGGGTLATVSVTLVSGSATPVSLSASVSPNETTVIVSFPSSPVTPPGSSAMTVNPMSTTPVGTYMVRITGTGGGVIHTTTYTLIVSLSSVSVVRGLDDALYSNSFASGSWGGWQGLPGAVSSDVTICPSLPGRVDAVVRGLDDVLYHNSFSAGSWSGQWDSAGGATLDQPACAALNGNLYAVARGLDNVTYYNTMSLSSGVWSGWVSLGGAASTPPVLVATPGANRLDIIVRGYDMRVYEEVFSNGSWSPTWDFIGGAISDPPIVLSDGTNVIMVAKGLDDGIYYNQLTIGSSWSGWSFLGAYTPSPLAAALDSMGTVHVVVRGFDNAVYHNAKPSGGVWAGWDIAGGATPDTPAVAAQGSSLVVVARGLDNAIYYNTLVASTWQGWAGVGGATFRVPALSSVP